MQKREAPKAKEGKKEKGSIPPNQEAQKPSETQEVKPPPSAHGEPTEDPKKKVEAPKRKLEVGGLHGPWALQRVGRQEFSLGAPSFLSCFLVGTLIEIFISLLEINWLSSFYDTAGNLGRSQI